MTNFDRELLLAGYVRPKRNTISLSIAQKDSVFLRTMFPRTYAFTPLSSYFYFTENIDGMFCDEHTDCIKLPWNAYDPRRGNYRVRLINPIILQTDMPGADHTLVYAEIQGQLNVSWFQILRNDKLFKVDDNGSTELWKVENERITMNNGSFFTNVYGTVVDPLNVSLSGYSNINVEFHNEIDGLPAPPLLGGFETHLRSPFITIMYTPAVPPQPATVTIRVANKATGSLVKNAFVELLAGNVVVASGYTKSDGTITFLNISGGMTGISYTLDIIAGGFYELTDSIAVKPGVNSFSYYLVPVPVPPLSDWVIPAVAITAVGAVGAVGYGLLKGRQGERPTQPIIIER